MMSYDSVIASVPRNAPTNSERDHLGSLALDQWRGLALTMVLISHGFYFTGRVHGIGRIGVNLFFFISGILVFRSLNHARARSASERTRSFWWRRLRRLYPALLAYVLAMLGATWWLQKIPGLPLNSDFFSYVKTIPAAVGYFINYLNSGPMALGHLWSLACEAQFYFLAPLIYWIGGTNDRRRLIIFGTFLMVLIGLGLAQPFIGQWKYHFEFAVWPMMLGFFFEYKKNWFKRIPEKILLRISHLSIVVCVVGIGLMLFGYKMKIVVIGAGALLVAPCGFGYLLNRPMPDSFGKSFCWLGERTYSIYLWQQPFTICDFLPSIWNPAGALISIGIGAMWFRIFEFPFLSAARQRQEKSK